jgi:ribonuclease BN (tRNA processing enzyme)
MTTVTLLGSGGWVPSSTRETCCTLVRRGPSALLLDAGSGVARLAEQSALLDGVDELTILLTHFHHDHVAGLSFLSLLELERPHRLLGPGAALYGEPTRAVVGRLLSPPFYTADPATLLDPIDDLPVGTIDVGPFSVDTRHQTRHSSPTLALRIDDAVALCTDTAADPENAGFARDVELLLHEAWTTEDVPRDVGSHSTAREAGSIAAAAGAGHLALVHVHPLQDVERLVAEARDEYPRAEVASDLLSFELD